MIRLTSGVIRWHMSQTLQRCDTAMAASIPHCCARTPTNKLSSDSATSSEVAGDSRKRTASNDQNARSSEDTGAMQNAITNGQVKATQTSSFGENIGLNSRTVQESYGKENVCNPEANTTTNSETCATVSSNTTDHCDASSGEPEEETIPSFFGRVPRFNQSVDSDAQLEPPDPETCCGSGCVNCVYIKYVQDVLDRDPNDRETVKEVLDQIEDFNVRTFIKLELGL